MFPERFLIIPYFCQYICTSTAADVIGLRVKTAGSGMIDLLLSRHPALFPLPRKLKRGPYARHGAMQPRDARPRVRVRPIDGGTGQPRALLCGVARRRASKTAQDDPRGSTFVPVDRRPDTRTSVRNAAKGSKAGEKRSLLS